MDVTPGRHRDHVREIYVHMQVKMVLALIMIVLLLVALLMLFAIEMMNIYGDGDDKRCAENDSFGEPEGNPNRSGTEPQLLNNLSAGGWPVSPNVADQLLSPAGEPSADRPL
jgi:hypothetical protein